MNKYPQSILIIAPLPPPVHGLSLATNQIIESQILHKFTLYVLNSSTGFIHEGGHFKISKFTKYLLILLKQIYYCLIYKPDYLYLTLAQTKLGLLRDSIILLIGASFRCKIIIHLHGNLFRKQYELLNNIEKKILAVSLSKVSKCVVPADIFIDSFDGLLGREKIVIINNGIEDTVHRSDLRVMNSEIINNRINILFLSNLIPQKGLEDGSVANRFIEDEGCRVIVYRLSAGFYDDLYSKNINILLDKLSFIENKNFISGS